MATAKTVVEAIASYMLAMENCESANPPNLEWRNRHAQAIVVLCDEALPRGSGFDVGVKLLAESTPDDLRFRADFHHVDENGSYDGWTEHVVRVRPSLALGFTLTISGRDRNGIKDYIGDVMHAALSAIIPGEGA